MSRGRKSNSSKEKEKKATFDYEDYIKKSYSDDTTAKRKNDIWLQEKDVQQGKEPELESGKCSASEDENQFLV
ncbi:hypothetical protein M9Y10_016630 [Tritrichomonas musculus]|uniref:Uncharacterized protein n=1 Tax=Tritrichomonas musculus TaxID=1915356 RepID=A0ABR2HWS9_9EUKA